MIALFAIVKQEIKCAGRERLAIALLAVFLGMTVASAAIGWASHHTVMSVYQATVVQMGRDVPNPFANTSSLEVIKNTVVYVVLIGALLAVVIGVRAGVRDRRAQVTDLILSRPIGPRAYVLGKLLGVQAWMGIVLVVALVASWLSVWVISGTPLTPASSTSLVGFFALAWLFLLPFSILGLIAGSKSQHESTALLVPILLWVAFTFVVPQLGTAENPSALLNPVPAIVPTTDVFFRVNEMLLQPISITEHFKHASGMILQLRDAGSTVVGGDLLSLGIVAVLSVGVLLLSARWSMRRPLYA
ncbi:MAG: ABC transporter permease [Actinobacteria bacterium]|nr:ABC transporter permease [Actinomycetota bacterium]